MTTTIHLAQYLLNRRERRRKGDGLNIIRYKMPPQPSQKGMFKPYKPKKIVKPGESSAAADSVNVNSRTAPSSTLVAFDPSTTGSGQSGVGDGSTNRYGNRTSNGGRGGGRGGRGRGRSPAPQGRVFFTGGERKPGSTSSSLGSSSKGKSSGPGVEPGTSRQRGATSSGRGNSRDAADSTEEVVGQLETAIGGNHAKNRNEGKGKAGSLLSGNKQDYYDDEADGGPGAKGPANLGVPGCMYDSDSSDEGSLTQKGHHTGFMAPLELPFPTKTLPAGVGSSKASRDSVEDGEEEVMNNTYVSASDMHNAKSSWTSPFVDVRQGKVTLQETNSWFLVQLPTRLPPLKQKNSPPASRSTMGDDDDDGLGAMVADSPPSNHATAMTSDFSEVITPPVMTSDFDNSLESVAPGQIGRILVYESGKTVLVMDDPDGKEVRNGRELVCRRFLWIAFHIQRSTLEAQVSLFRFFIFSSFPYSFAWKLTRASLAPFSRKPLP